jgi:hypothetical protein
MTMRNAPYEVTPGGRVLAAGIAEFTLPAGADPGSVRVSYYPARVPPPIQGSARVYCPESSPEGLRCDWRRRARRKTLKKYRQHWRRTHR